MSNIESIANCINDIRRGIEELIMISRANDYEFDKLGIVGIADRLVEDIDLGDACAFGFENLCSIDTRAAKKARPIMARIGKAVDEWYQVWKRMSNQECASLYRRLDYIPCGIHEMEKWLSCPCPHRYLLEVLPKYRDVSYIAERIAYEDRERYLMLSNIRSVWRVDILSDRGKVLQKKISFYQMAFCRSIPAIQAQVPNYI